MYTCSMINFSHIQKESLPETIARELRKSIFSEKFKPGERLPSESSLAEMFGTNRTTLREAIRILASEGLLEVGQGRPAQVLDFRRTATVSAMPYYLEVIPLSENTLVQVQEVLELRREFLVFVTPLALSKGDPAQLAAVQEAGKEVLAAKGKDAYTVHLADSHFCSCLVAATQNVAFQLISNTYLQSFSPMLERVLRLIRFPDSYFDRLPQLFAAIEQREPDVACRVFKEHLRQLDEEMLAMMKQALKLVGPVSSLLGR